MTQHTNLHKVVVPRILTEVFFCRRSPGESFTVSQLLEVVQPASNAFVAIRVENVEVDRRPAIASGVEILFSMMGLRLTSTMPGRLSELALTNMCPAYSGLSGLSVSPSRRGFFHTGGILPPNLAMPSLRAVSMASLTRARVAESVFGMRIDTEYFARSEPSIARGSHTLA